MRFDDTWITPGMHKLQGCVCVCCVRVPLAASDLLTDTASHRLMGLLWQRVPRSSRDFMVAALIEPWRGADSATRVG